MDSDQGTVTEFNFKDALKCEVYPELGNNSSHDCQGIRKWWPALIVVQSANRMNTDC